MNLGTDAEVLLNAMQVKKSNQNIDTQPFFLRNVLGTRLRAENPGKIPVLLYWHPSIDSCASICRINGIDLGQTNRSTSIIEKIKGAFGQITPTNDVAVSKLLVTNTETLHYVAEHQLKSIQKNAIEHIQKLYQSSWESNWAKRRKEVEEKLPKWDAHDLQMVVAFYIPNAENVVLLNAYSKIMQIDTNHRGDDGLLRLYVSIEFQRGLRDMLIEQQRRLNFLSDQHARYLLVESQRKAKIERELKEVEEQKEKEERERLMEEQKQAILEKKRKDEDEEEKDQWIYDQDDNSSMLQKAGGLVVNSASSLVGGATTLVGGGATMAVSGATFAATTIVGGGASVATTIVGGGASMATSAAMNSASLLVNGVGGAWNGISSVVARK